MYMDWTTLLRAQQADFITRLKSGSLLHCETQGQHSELTIISGERLKHLRAFCWRMAEKYKRNSPVRDVFINNLKGKLGEEVVKARLAEFVDEVDYEQRPGGDGKVDFTLTSDPFVGIQVKSRHGSIDTVRWSISLEEVNKNTILICILIQEEVSEAETKYNLIHTGFLPTNMIEVSNSEASVGIYELLYSGGLQSYIESIGAEASYKRAKVYYERGNLHLTLHDIQEAIEDFKRAAKLYCENNHTHELAKWTVSQLRESNREEAIYYIIKYLANGSFIQKRTATLAIHKLSSKFKESCNLAVPYLLDNLSEPIPELREFTLEVILDIINVLAIPNSAASTILEIAENDPRDSIRDLAKSIVQKIKINSTTGKLELL